MNTRMRELRKFLTGMSTGGAVDQLWYTWYVNTGNTVTTEFYFGPMSTTRVPTTIEGTTVTALGCTTYCDDQIVQNVIIPNTITEIE